MLIGPQSVLDSTQNNRSSARSGCSSLSPHKWVQCWPGPEGNGILGHSCRLAAATGAFSGDQIAYRIGKQLAVGQIPFMAGPRGRRALDWADRTLARRGSSFILAAPHPGRAGGRERDLRRSRIPASTVRPGLVAIASLTWALYCAVIGIGAGTWFKGHPLRAIVIGVVGGLLIGLTLDLGLQRLANRRSHAAEPHQPGA